MLLLKLALMWHVVLDEQLRMDKVLGLILHAMHLDEAQVLVSMLPWYY
jgi:hypothetical protein